MNEVDYNLGFNHSLIIFPIIIAYDLLKLKLLIRDADNMEDILLLYIQALSSLLLNAPSDHIVLIGFHSPSTLI